MKFFKKYINPSAGYWEDKSKPIVIMEPIHPRLPITLKEKTVEDLFNKKFEYFLKYDLDWSFIRN